MEIVIRRTEEIVTVDGLRCRLWQGVTTEGIRCVLYVHRVRVADEDAAAFERSSNLSAASPPKIGPPAVDMRMVL